ncbi:MAG TPA: MBL fold metallo-hydrolase [Gemmatimonadota bacterium]|nr:MBL fold metallo-hydrolase [Gemmatimonadota bacterium]
MPPLDPEAGPEEIAPGCVRITLPDPFVPGVTAVFLVGESSAPVLLDAGAGTDECEAALRDELAGLGHAVADLPMILSHTHLDHAGGLLRATPRELTVHARAEAEMRDIEPRSSRGPSALCRMGVDEATIAEFAPHGEPVGDAPLADVRVDRTLAGPAGEVPGAPNWRWLLAEGHAPGHLMLFDTTSRTLLAADQFLQKWKTPLIVSDPGFDSFGAYVESIEAARRLEPARICSSHTRTIEDAAGWLADMQRSLERRLERVADIVADRSGAAGLSAEDVLAALYPAASRGPLRIVFLREILAMLRHLAFTGRLERETTEGVERFRA